MQKLRLIALSALALTLSVGTAHAIDINGKKGLGYASSIGGVQGLAFNYGVGNLAIEGILGLRLASGKTVGDDETAFGVGIALGAHFAAIRAEKAAITIGARFNLANSSVKTDGSFQVDDEGKLESITQFGFDIPFRAYWFPNKHFSLHTEFGIAILIGPKDGVIMGSGVPADGVAVQIFDNGFSGLLGGAGATFWW